MEVDGRVAARIMNTTNAPLQKLVLKVEKPSVTAKRYAVSGEIKYEGVQGAGYLEMWSVFPNGRYFSRTLGAPGSGAMAQITGSSDWREFSLPFDSTGASGPPTQIEVNISLPSRGTVFIGPLKLVQIDAQTKVTEATPVPDAVLKELPPSLANKWQERRAATSRVPSPPPGSAVFAAELPAAKAELEMLRQRFHEKHPQVMQQSAKVAALEREAAEHPDEPEELRAARIELAQLRQRYALKHPAVLEQLAKIAALEKQFGFADASASPTPAAASHKE